jgi:lipid II:glycine glycyltransferase (peptidoglycan interpeptide bridge formation enzyme)
MHINNPFQDKDFRNYQLKAGRAKVIELIDQQIVYIYPLFKNFTILYTNQNHSKLTSIAKKHKAIYTLIETTETKIDSQPTRHKIKEIIPRHTNLIKLEQDVDSILKNMHKKGRYNIRLAKKHSIEIKQSNNIKAFYSILKTTSERDGFNIHPQNLYKQMLETLQPKNKAKLFLAYHSSSKQPIAGILDTYIKDTATYYYGASDHQYRKYMAPYLLQWHAIQDAKNNNYKYYDFLGVADPNKKNDTLLGVTNFKNKFSKFKNILRILLFIKLYCRHKNHRHFWCR